MYNEDIKKIWPHLALNAVEISVSTVAHYLHTCAIVLSCIAFILL